MLGDWHLYLVALVITIVLYAFLSWLQGPDTVCVFCNGSGLYPDEAADWARSGVNAHCVLAPVSTKYPETRNTAGNDK